MKTQYTVMVSEKKIQYSGESVITAKTKNTQTKEKIILRANHQVKEDHMPLRLSLKKEIQYVKFWVLKILVSGKI